MFALSSHQLTQIMSKATRTEGRGLIQITGRANYQQCSQAFNNASLLDTSELFEQPAAACRPAAWFWSEHRLNALADQSDFRTITRKINGGLNGLEQRTRYWDKAKAVLRGV